MDPAVRGNHRTKTAMNPKISAITPALPSGTLALRRSQLSRMNIRGAQEMSTTKAMKHPPPLEPAEDLAVELLVDCSRILAWMYPGLPMR